MLEIYSVSPHLSRNENPTEHRHVRYIYLAEIELIHVFSYCGGARKPFTSSKTLSPVVIVGFHLSSVMLIV